MTKALFLRHAETELTERGNWHGEADPPISAEGRRHARAAGRRLARMHLDVAIVVSSNAIRTMDTAKILARALGVDVVTDGRLRERDLGRWANLTRDEIEGGWPGQLDLWQSGLIGGPPQGETDQEASARAVNVLLSYAELPQSGSVLFVAHAGLLRALLAVDGLPNEPVTPLAGRWLTLLAVERRVVVGEAIVV